MFLEADPIERKNGTVSRIHRGNRGEKMAWNCPKCRKTNSDEITVCDCGHVREIPTTEETEKKMVTCANCNQKTPLMDKYCINCGKEISLVPSQFNTEINRAAKWIMIIGILFIIFGTYFGFQHKAEADQAKTMISHLSDSDTLNVPINGKNYTVGELKVKIDQEVRLVFITNYFLAFAMIGLYFWARRAPFPAMVTEFPVS